MPQSAFNEYLIHRLSRFFEHYVHIIVYKVGYLERRVPGKLGKDISRHCKEPRIRAALRTVKLRVKQFEIVLVVISASVRIIVIAIVEREIVLIETTVNPPPRILIECQPCIKSFTHVGVLFVVNA